MHIRIHNLIKTFGSVRATDGISLEFAAGQIHGILGENGAGKSTLMKLLSGFLRRDAGEIRLDGHPVRLGNPAAALHAGIGMIHQDPLDIPAFTVLENFYCASPRAALPDMKAARRAFGRFSAHLGFAMAPDAPLASLTVGQRQQLEIMRLLACGVRVLILDEPTTGITPAQVRALFAALRQMASEGTTVLFVSHKLDDIANLCDTVSVLRAGRVMGEGQMPMPQAQAHLLRLMFGHSLQMLYETPPSITLPPTSNPPVWQLECVSARAGILMLQDVTLSIRPGTVVGLAGLEGSGQQLLLHLLAGTLHPLAGRVLLNGSDVTGQPAAVFQQRGVQILPADRMKEGLVGAFSLCDHMALTSRSPGVLVDKQAAQARAQTAIADYEIKATPTTPLAALSGGNQQRAMLSLLPERCTGLLMEQPSRGLDVASARAIWQRLLARRSDGTALVFASADLDEVLEYSDEILVFLGGKSSQPLARAELSETRLAELIGGVGFEAINDKQTTDNQ